ncbi:hypothetical protein DL769_001491 [Monosporascus sp. CRB-8-3]|nr:hypothetical protein DL769_001491 [Monosporascus sp. CRB-8-3]
MQPLKSIIVAAFLVHELSSARRYRSDTLPQDILDDHVKEHIKESWPEELLLRLRQSQDKEAMKLINMHLGEHSNKPTIANALREAATKKKFKIVKRLLDDGVHPDLCLRPGEETALELTQTALAMASPTTISATLEILQLLYRHGAKTHPSRNSVDIDFPDIDAAFQDLVKVICNRRCKTHGHKDMDDYLGCTEDCFDTFDEESTRDDFPFIPGRADEIFQARYWVGQQETPGTDPYSTIHHLQPQFRRLGLVVIQTPYVHFDTYENVQKTKDEVAFLRQEARRVSAPTTVSNDASSDIYWLGSNQQRGGSGRPVKSTKDDYGRIDRKQC